MKKFFSALVLLSFLAVLLVPNIAFTQTTEPVKCIKLGRDIIWKGGYIYTGTVKKGTSDENETCTETEPCKCNDPSDFPKGCRLLKDNTVGPRKAIQPDIKCSQKNKNGKTNKPPDYQTPAWGMIGLLNGIEAVINWVFVILMIVSGLFIIWGAFTLVTAAGAPDKVSSGRNYIIYALIGLAVALLAKALPSIVEALLGV